MSETLFSLCDLEKESSFKKSPVASSLKELCHHACNGLPKTHKPSISVRPILPMTRSAYEPLSKWLAAVLKPVEDAFNTRSVKDSFAFVDKLSVLHVP